MQKAVFGKSRELWLMVSQWQTPRRHLTAGALLHTLTVQVSVAAIEFSLALDALGRIFALPPLSLAGYWSLLTAAWCATVGVFAGVLTRRRWQKQTKPEGGETATTLRNHAYLGSLFYALLIGLTIWRMKLQSLADASVAINVLYFIALALLSAVMIFQVWLGGEVVVRMSEGETLTQNQGRYNEE